MINSQSNELAQARLESLREAALKQDMEIRFDSFSDAEIAIQSGFCKVRGKPLIVVDNRLPADDQIEIILNIFRQFDWEEIYLPSWIRERLENPVQPGIAT